MSIEELEEEEDLATTHYWEVSDYAEAELGKCIHTAFDEIEDELLEIDYYRRASNYQDLVQDILELKRNENRN